MIVPQPSGSGAGERKAFEGVRDRVFGLAGITPVSSSLCLCRLRDEEVNPALSGVPFADLLTARVSVFVDDITVFVTPPPGYRGCEEGGWRVQPDSRSQGQF